MKRKCEGIPSCGVAGFISMAGNHMIIFNYWGNLFDSQGISKDKLVLGVPLYAQPEDPAVKPVSYQAVINNNPKNAAKDRISMNGISYYYNGSATMKKKTALALNRGFGGMMIWGGWP